MKRSIVLTIEVFSTQKNVLQIQNRAKPYIQLVYSLNNNTTEQEKGTIDYTHVKKYNVK